MKYALKLKLGEGDWIYVTDETSSNCWDLQPMLFESYEQADRHAQTWRITGKETNVQIVEYLEG